MLHLVPALNPIKLLGHDSADLVEALHSPHLITIAALLQALNPRYDLIEAVPAPALSVPVPLMLVMPLWQHLAPLGRVGSFFHFSAICRGRLHGTYASARTGGACIYLTPV